jgi:hypothetical protein
MGNICGVDERQKLWYVFVDNNYNKEFVELKLFSNEEFAQEYEDYIYHCKDPQTNDITTKIGEIWVDPDYYETSTNFKLSYQNM